jgi:DNA adenine methylase
MVEPFVGGMSISLGILPEQSLVNDINPHLINFYQWLQKGLVTDPEFRNEREYYLDRRKEFNEIARSKKLGSKREAELFYYLNKQCFNGLCRFNNKGEFNSPFGGARRDNGTKDLTEYANLVKDWKFSCGDFAQIKVSGGDFIYADPPYDVEFTKYSKEDFKWGDQVRLANWLASWSASNGVTVMTSNQATGRIIDLYKGLSFRVELVEAPRRISSNGDRTPAKEILAYNF